MIVLASGYSCTNMHSRAFISSSTRPDGALSFRHHPGPLRYVSHAFQPANEHCTGFSIS